MFYIKIYLSNIILSFNYKYKIKIKLKKILILRNQVNILK